MKGFANLVKACWCIKQKHDLTDREISKLLGRVNEKYKSRIKFNEDVGREYIIGLIYEDSKKIKGGQINGPD